MNSTLKALAALACWIALPAAALNHEVVVNPLPPGKFPVACSNLEIDSARLAQLGGLPADYYEGHEVNGSTRYVSDILAHPEAAFRFSQSVPLKPWLYPTLMFQTPEFVAIICHPTSAANTDADYQLPDGGKLPHMQPAGSAPKLVSALEYASVLGVSVSPPPPNGPAQLPLVVYSHGLGGSPVGSGYIDVAVQLAAQGYMVAAVFHADNRYSPVRIEDLGDFAFALAFFPVIVQMQALRPFALKTMTDRLLTDTAFGPGIDRTRIGAFGASLGGEAVAHLVGAKLTADLFADSCEFTERDSRIRAAVGYVPYSGQTFLPAFCDDQSGADTVDKPYLAISGTADLTAPIGMTRQAVNRMASSHYLVSLEGGKHELRPEDAGDVLTWMITFLNAYMDVRSDPGAMARFIRMGGVTGGRPDSMVVDVHKPFPNQGSEVVAREFRNTILDHYFIAAGQDEIDIILAGGAGPGWELTGESFKVWPSMPADPALQAAPVCRFYGGLSGGPNSHFFTADAQECAMVKSRGGWFYEGIGFYARPVDSSRECPAGWLSVNRAYNNGFVRNDSNHRFTTSNSSARELEGRGWTVEGTSMCALP